MKNELAYTVDDFAAAVGMRRWWVHQKIKDGELPYFKIGRRTYIRRADAQQWLDSFPVQRGRNTEAA